MCVVIHGQAVRFGNGLEPAADVSLPSVTTRQFRRAGKRLVCEVVTNPYQRLACESPLDQVGLVLITKLYHARDLSPAASFEPLPSPPPPVRGHTRTHDLLSRWPASGTGWLGYRSR